MYIFLGLLPHSSHSERFFEAFIKKPLIANAIQAQADHDVFADRHRWKRIRFLENHADATPNDRWIDRARVEIVAVEQNCAFHTRLWRPLVHAVQRTEQ